MFEGLVASVLNKWLGKYVEDLDTEHLNVGIFSGEVRLHNLYLKPEALYELELPIEVKYGVIGTINLVIPWSSLSSQAIVVNVEDILIVAHPVGTEEYSAEKERRLLRALKKNVLDNLEGENILGTGSGTLIDGLLSALTNNVQIYFRKIHVRYEDRFCNKGIFCGLCIEGISMETTNSKWKPCAQPTGNSSTIYQVAKLEAASVYFNTETDESDFLGDTWREDLRAGLQTFSVKGKTFDFLIKPFNAKMKTIVSRSTEARVPKLLVDLVIHDLVSQLSRSQLHSIIALIHLFHQIHLRRDFLSFRPTVPIHENCSKWWKYSYNAVLQQRVHPYKWENIRKHRSHYHEYKELYRKVALNPGDTELRLDLSQAEDNLPLSSIVIAREHGKIEIKNEDPDRIEIISTEEKWWSFGNNSLIKFQVKPEKPRGIWSQLSPTERQKLKDLEKSDVGVTPEKAKKYIEHKVNITIYNLSGSVFVRGNEIASAALSQFLGSFETRPAANAFKISARAENFVLEGASTEQGLIPIINVTSSTGNSSSNFLYVDFEKNPLAVEADYGITINLEQMEINYHERAFSECLNFFQGVGVTQNYLKTNLLFLWEKFILFKRMIESRQIRVDVNMCIKGPHLVIAESGSLLKSGMLTIVDLGKWTLHTDLQQPLCLDDATQMELEERLYDRLHINLDGFQILFCDSGDRWRDSLKLDDTEHHILSKVRGQIVLSSSIKPDYRLLPKSKLNITLYNVKINLSDRRLVMFLDFLEGLPLPSSNTVSVAPIIVWTVFQDDVITPIIELDLKHIKNLVVSSELSRQRTPDHSESMTPSLGALALDKNWSSVEVSDEDVELWARTVDLPGFDDNISPNNIITSLLRVVVGEIVLVLCRSNEMVDRPYIMARISKCQLDSAFMVYGPAIQATLGGIQLIDKLHVGPSGEYLEIISTQSDADFMTLLYRKVRSDCPDFKSHFHSVEQSLVLDIGVLALTIHREALLTFTKYLQYLGQKVVHREILVLACDMKYLKSFLHKFESRDPPIPPGAVKFSYSTHLTEFRLKLCDTELEFLELKVKGFESDCMFKANERMVLRAYLSYISLDDLSEVTLYPKIISVEEDKVFEMKYVRHSPRLYTKGFGSGKDDVHTDGSLKLSLEKIHLVLVYKMVVDIQHFIEPLVPIGVIWQITGFLRRSFSSQINQLRGWNTRLHLSISLHLPVLLVPQKAASPNSLVVNLGELNVENFFKELTGSKEESSNVIDNILLKLESASLSRATVTLSGRLEIQEDILEPIHVRFDVKRFVGGTAAMSKVGHLSKYREIPLFEVFGNLEPVKISFGQKDLSTFLSVWKENLADRKFLETSWWWKSASPIDGRTPTENDDLFVRKLQVFLSHSDACRKDTIARFTIDSVTIDFYNDIGEVLSSPVRDLSHGLCRLTLWDASLFLEKNYDSSIEMKMALQTCLLEDIRTDPSVIVKKVFQSHHGGESKLESTISISTPPIIDVTFKQTQTGERCIDILVEKTRLNLSVSFLIAIAKFAMDSIPVNKTEGGFINHGYVGDLGQQGRVPEGLKITRPPLSADSTSGYYSSGVSCATDEQCGLSVSLQFRKPEVVIFASGERKTSAILFRCELLADWSKHPGRNALVISLAGLQAWSKSHPDPTSLRQKTSIVLHQCDIEIARNVKSVDDCMNVTVMVSPVDFRLSVATVATIGEIIQEFQTNSFFEDCPSQFSTTQTFHDHEDLWSPKKISSYCEADVCAASEPLLPQQPSFPVGRPAESLSVSIPRITVVLEVSQGVHRRPLFLASSTFKLAAYDWSSSINLKGEFQIQAAYFNENIGTWEPFIEPCNNNGENVHRPWELVFQIFQGKSFPISPHINFQNDHSNAKGRKVSNQTDEPEESETSGDESDHGMTFLRRRNYDNVHEVKKQNFSLSSGDSSDSENEDKALEKLTSAVGHLFTSGVSDAELSESTDTSATDDEELEEPEAETEEETASARSTGQERAIFLKKHSDSVDSGLETEAIERFAAHVLIHSKDRLEITVTPSSIKVLQEMTNAFSGSPSLPVASLDGSVSVKNTLGPGSVATLLAKVDSSNEKPVVVAHYDRGESPPSSPGSVTSNPSVTSDWDSDFESLEKETEKPVLSSIFQYSKDSVTKLYDRLTENRILIQIPGFNDLKVVAPKTSCSKLHVLHPSRNQTRYHVILTAYHQHGFRKYLIRGPLQIHNDTSYAMGIYYKKSIIESLGEKIIGEATNPFEDMIRLAVIEPDDILDIPLFVAYHCKLHVMPAHVSNYQISESGLSWQEMMSDMGSAKDLCCLSKQDNDSAVFSVRACCEENIKILNSPRSMPNCLIRLQSPLMISNLLPYAIEVKLTQIKHEVRIEAGDKTNIYFLNIQKPQKIGIEIPEYLGILWVGSFNLTTDVEEKVLTMVTEQDTDGGNKQLSLNLRVIRSPTVNIQVHSQYWIINKTGLPLQIRGSLTDFIHEWSGEGPLLFSFRKQRRRCVRVRAFSSSWSSAFSLDAPGCSGLVICKDKERNRRYKILVQSDLSQMCPKLTKIVSFLPNFIVTNSCRKHLRFMEDNERADLWIDIAPGQCLPFWPETDSMRMFVKFRDSKHISQHFPVTVSHRTVLRMDKGCGITVEVTGSIDQPFSIRFQNYKPGDAPVRIDNQCEDLFLKFHQKDSGQVALLSPYQSLLYTWDDPSKERTLLWNVYNNKGKDFCVPFWKDGFGEERVSFHVVRSDHNNSNDTMTAKLSAGLKRLTPKSSLPEERNSSSSSDDSEEDAEKPQLAKKTRRDKIVVYWASFLDNNQRVLLFTQDERTAKRAKRALDAERSHLELFVSIAGVGLSLINSDKQGIPRELAYCSLSDSAAQWEVTVAHRWKTVALELASWLEDKYKQGSSKAQIKDYIHIDFEKMQMTKPFFGEIRRKHRPAIWIQYRRSKHMSLFHFQLHRLQIDNQLHEAEFPTVLYPVPPPLNSAKYNPRPAVEVAFLKKYSPRCNDVYKFVKVVVQEHCVQLERCWLSEISQYYDSWWPQENPSAKIRHDIALVHMPISAIASKRARGNENMFEYLHCSPIKIQILFSSQTDPDPKDFYSNPFIDYFLFTLAPSFAQVKSITVKFLCFEVIGQLCNKDFVWDQGIQHIKSQFWQQLHVLVMGINVLANPYSQFLDFSDDCHPFFYEPYLESVGVPEEFSEGISAGALGLLGHETGGPSGAATLFAALLGTALQTVVQHEEPKRKVIQNVVESDFPESIIQSTSNFSAICPLALSGVVMKRNPGNGPLHGVEDFFKGPGKGLMGLMTKSTCGVFNCLSMISDGVKRAVEMGESIISRVRPPRYVNPVLGLRPYCTYEVRGLTLQKILCRGLYSSDIYWAHAALTPESKTILLITLQHIFLVGKYKIWGSYEPIWILRMDDLMAVPTIENEKLIFSVRQDENVATVWNEEKSAHSTDIKLLQWLKNQIEAALVISMEDKPCP